MSSAANKPTVAELDRAVMYLAKVRARSAMALFAREDVMVPVFDIYDASFTDGACLDRCKALRAALVRLGLLRKVGKRYALPVNQAATDGDIAAAVAAEMRASGVRETSVAALAFSSVALARLGLHGDAAIDRLSSLRGSHAVRVSYLMGHPQVMLTA